MKKHFDCLVIGVGGIGSAACYYAAKKNWSVLGVEQFQSGNARGSSHGQTRIIRQAYFEHPSYVPLAKRSYQAWAEIEQESKIKLFHQTGLLQVGWPGNEVIDGILGSAKSYNLPVEQLTATECRKRFPQFKTPDDQIGVYEHTAGFLLVEKCVQAMIQLAVENGAELLFNRTVRSFQFEDGRFNVNVDGENYFADHLVVAAGPWSQTVLSELGLSLQVVRKHQHWFHFPNRERFNDCPVYLIETHNGYFYGFPAVDGKGFKVAEHTQSEPVKDPSKVNRQTCLVDSERVRQFIKQRLQAESPEHLDHSVCMYTMSEDGNFVIDRHPENPRMVFTAGMSGHGFKFTPVIGKHLVDLSAESKYCDLDFDFLKRR